MKEIQAQRRMSAMYPTGNVRCFFWLMTVGIYSMIKSCIRTPYRRIKSIISNPRDLWCVLHYFDRRVTRVRIPFWRWWAMNRDLTDDKPAWQFWYYEITAYIKTKHINGNSVVKYSQDMKTGKPLAIKRIKIMNFYKFPLLRSLRDGKIRHNGTLINLHSTPESAHASPASIEG